MYKIQVVDNIGKIGRKRWNKLNNTAFLDFGWFKTIESLNKQLKPQHIVVYQNKEIIAIAPCYIQYEEFLDTTDIMLFGRLANIVNKVYNFKPSLVCYSPLSQSSNIIGQKDQKILNAIIRKMEEICRQSSINCYCFPYVSDPVLIDLISKAGLKKCYFIEKNVLKLKNTFKTYRMSLSKNMQKSIKREMNKLKKLDIKIEITNKFREHPETITKLYQLVYNKHFKKQNLLNDDFFRNLGNYLKKRVVLVTAKKENKVIAFSLLLKDNDGLQAYKTGYCSDYPRLYFNMFYNLPIEYAFQKKFKYIDFGSALSNLKRRRGCKQIPVYAFFGFESKIWNILMHNYIKFLNKKKQIFKTGQ